MTQALSTILLFLFCVNAAAGDLIEIDRGNTPGRIYIEKDTIEREGPKVQFWYVLDVYAAHRKKGTKVYGEHDLMPLEYYKSNKINFIFDCKNRKSAFIRLKAYDKAAAKGPQIGSYATPPDERKWKKIVKGGTTDVLFPHVCNV